MRVILISFFFVSLSAVLFAQSETTQAFHENNKDALSLFFYKNTLRMINQSDNEEFDELISNIEKMKFLLIDKNSGSFGTAQFKKLITDYKREGYEEILTSRVEGRNFDIYIKEKNRKTTGTVVLVNDVSNLYILDVLGSIPLNKVPDLFKNIDESTDIGKKIKTFTGNVEKKIEESNH